MHRANSRITSEIYVCVYLPLIKVDLIQARYVKNYTQYSSQLQGDFKSLNRFEVERVMWLAGRFLGNSDETPGGDYLFSFHHKK